MPKNPTIEEIIPMSDVLRRAESDAALASETAPPDIGPIEEPPAVASPTLTLQADVPYFSATDALARDIETKIGESQQKLDELAHDIEMSKTNRDSLIESADYFRNRLQDAAQEAFIHTRDLANNNHLQEVAILRGRETDEIKRITALKDTIAKLQR